MADPRFSGRAIPDPGFAADDGTADPVLRRLVDDVAEGAPAGELLRHLVGARLLVPVVAVLEESEVGSDGLRHEKTSAMASVTVEAADGSRSLLAFTCTDTLRAWRPDARPIAADGRRTAQAALAEGADRLVVDAAGPATFVLAGGELRALALAADPGLPVADDPAVRQAVFDRVATVEGVVGCRVLPRGAASVRVEVTLAPEVTDAAAVIAVARERLAADVGLRARLTGLELAVGPAEPAADPVRPPDR